MEEVDEVEFVVVGVERFFSLSFFCFHTGLSEVTKSFPASNRKLTLNVRYKQRYAGMNVVSVNIVNAEKSLRLLFDVYNIWVEGDGTG